MGKVQHFEIPADDMGRAKKFYGEAFDWKMQDVPNFPDYIMAYTVEVDDKFMAKEPNAINGGITKRGNPATMPVMYITVDSLEDAMEKVKKAGGSIETEVKEVMGMGKYVLAKDSEGNTVGVWESVRKG